MNRKEDNTDLKLSPEIQQAAKQWFRILLAQIKTQELKGNKSLPVVFSEEKKDGNYK